MIKNGDKVYIKAVVTKVPEADRTMYRLETLAERSVIWCTKDEIIKAAESAGNN